MSRRGDTAQPQGASGLERFGKNLGASAILVIGLLGSMWIIEALDTAVLMDRLQRNGILPRSTDGLDGIIWSPFLHSGFPHLISNSVPFALLSTLVLTGGRARYIKASLLIILIGGLMVWAFAIGNNENHIGASGWVFGLLGFLIAAALLEKRAVSLLAGAVAMFFYGGIIISGITPTEGISWEGHLFGFIAGLVAAKLTVPKKSLPSFDPPEHG